MQRLMAAQFPIVGKSDMPGAYAHITLVNQFREPNRLESIDGFSDWANISVLDYFQFCELGVVSPDYPYLAIG